MKFVVHNMKNWRHILNEYRVKAMAYFADQDHRFELKTYQSGVSQFDLRASQVGL